MVSSSVTLKPARFSPSVLPVTVLAPVFMNCSSCFITPCVPPAASNASVVVSPFGRTAVSKRNDVGICLEQLVDVDVAARFLRDRGQMLGRIDRAADAEHHHHRVLERLGGEDLARLQVLVDHGDDALAGLLDELPHPVAVGEDRRRARQRHAERLAGGMQRVRRAHAGADAGPAGWRRRSSP